MKRIIKIVFLSFLLIVLFSITVNAEDYDVSSIWDGVDKQTRNYLEDLGIDEINFDELFDLTPTRIIEFVLSLAFQKGFQITKYVLLIIVVLYIISITLAFLKESDKIKNVISFVGILIILSTIIVEISRITIDVISALRTTTIFVNSYLPIMTAIIVASRNPSLAVTYNSFSVLLSSAITTITDKFLMPCISTILTFNILSSFSMEDFRNRVISTFKRIITTILALFSTIYTGLLTTQSILVSTKDSIALKGIKFVSGTFVPIVGAGVGDAISSIFSSFVIMRNTMGVFVIIVIILVNLPVIVELLVWYFAIQICSIISSLLGTNNITDILDSLSSIVSLLNVLLFFITIVLVISTGIVISVGK